MVGSTSCSFSFQMPITAWAESGQWQSSTKVAGHILSHSTTLPVIQPGPVTPIELWPFLGFSLQGEQGLGVC